MTRRLPLLLLVGLAALMWLAVPGPLARLATARGERARLAAEAVLPPLRITALLPRAAVLPAPDAAAAGRVAAARIAGLARAAGLLAERAVPAAGAPAVAMTDVAVSGSEDRLRRFVTALEAARPAIRLARWRMEALPGGGVRLAGLAATAWAPADEAAAAAPHPVALARPAAIDARPLFAAEPVEAAAGEGPELLGVAGRLGQDAVALVRGADGATRSIAPGGAVDGWTLSALSADAALFTRGAERLRVPLPAQ